MILVCYVGFWGGATASHFDISHQEATKLSNMGRVCYGGLKKGLFSELNCFRLNRVSGMFFSELYVVGSCQLLTLVNSK